MIRRTLDPSWLNGLANHPDIRPHVGGEGVLDLSAAIARLDNVALAAEHGGFLFERLDAGLYEVHTMLLPAGRGRGVVPTALAAARYMFTHTDCVEIVTKVPASNRAAALMAPRCGFQHRFTRPKAWADGSDVDHLALTLEHWRAIDPETVREGQAFHALLESAKAAIGSTLPTHPEDRAHDQVVGAAVLMAKAGQVAKAAWTYNRWARFAGYQTVEVLALTPPVLDVRDALLTVVSGELEVLVCR